MPIFGRMDKPEMDKAVSVMLTPIGKTKAEEMSMEKPKLDILSFLLEDGTQTIRELSKKSGYSFNKTKDICKSLATSGYLKPLKV